MTFLHLFSSFYAQNSHAIIVALLLVGAAAFTLSIVRSTSSPAPAPQRRRATDY